MTAKHLIGVSASDRSHVNCHNRNFDNFFHRETFSAPMRKIYRNFDYGNSRERCLPKTVSKEESLCIHENRITSII